MATDSYTHQEYETKGHKMKLSYQNANPYSGHESYYLKFKDTAGTNTNCVLVDSGENVDVKNELGPDEFLSSILLTHAHADHYQTLGKNIQDGAEIVTTPATASVLESVLSDASRHASTQDMEWEEMEGSVESITDWHQIAPDVEVYPVPAGHVPGACGFLVRFDGDRHLLATGDFTFDRTAGYPPLPEEELMDIGIDVLFLNASTSEANSFTESIDNILEQAVSGGQVLVSASGMACVEYAYALGYLSAKWGTGTTVSIAGQAAKIYEDLGYDVPGVTAYPVYEDTGEVFEDDICLSGPEGAKEGSSKRLFGAIRDDPSASLVRILGSHGRSTVSAGCTVIDFEHVNHPTEDRIREFVERLNPMHTVVQHKIADDWGGVFDFTMTWADHKDESRVLYSDGEWEPPGWLKEGTRDMIIESNRRNRDPDLASVIESDSPEEFLTPEPPSLSRFDEADLKQEGIKTEEIQDRKPMKAEEPDSGQPEAQKVADGEKTNKSEQSNGKATEDTVSDESSVSLEDLQQSLDRIEEKVDSETHEAFVIDTGRGDVLLRLEGMETANLGVNHGEKVEVSVSKQE